MPSYVRAGIRKCARIRALSEGDWLVIYRVEKQELQLVLTRTGSHDDLF